MTTATPQRILISEKGESVVDLTLMQAMELQDQHFCRITPTQVAGRWRVTDVNKVGVAAAAGCELHIVPKTPLENIVYMASLGGIQLHLGPVQTHYSFARSVPAALSRAYLTALDNATRRGLLKGYRHTRESSSVVRGRWDISAQLATRPGIPLPVEVEFDDFTENIDENRILKTALRVIDRLEGLSSALEQAVKGMQVLFADVDPLPRGVPLPDVRLHRLNGHYAVPLRLARVILEAVSWTHRDGAVGGGTYLVDMATVFEGYVAARLKVLLADQELDVTAQDRRWWLDAGRSVALRPDIVISRGGRPLTVADTKYKVLGDGRGSVPNGDVYQAVAYALALDAASAHLIYVSGDVSARVLDIPVADVRVHIHALPLAGSIEQLETNVVALAEVLTRQSR